MKKIFPLLALSFSLMIIASCKKDAVVAIVPPIEDNSIPSGAVLTIRQANKTTATLDFTLDLTVFRDSKNIENQLNADNFSIDSLIISSTHYLFERTGVNFQNGTAATAYSALMLMDQSGSILSTDPKDYRIDAAKAFCTNLGQGDNVMLWSFAGSSLKQYGTGFTTNGSSLVPDIESLKGKPSGSTPLYKSQFSVTNYTATNASSVNKAVMTFTDGEDTEGGYTTDQVIANAIAKDVKLYNVGLGAAQIQALNNEASATGGAFMFAQDARQLISMFGNLGKLLNKTAQYYHTTWRVTRKTGTFTKGNISHKVKVALPYNNAVIYIPFSLDYQ